MATGRSPHASDAALECRALALAMFGTLALAMQCFGTTASAAAARIPAQPVWTHVPGGPTCPPTLVCAWAHVLLLAVAPRREAARATNVVLARACITDGFAGMFAGPGRSSK